MERKDRENGRAGGKRRREEERGGKEKEVVGEGWVGQREEYYALP